MKLSALSCQLSALLIVLGGSLAAQTSLSIYSDGRVVVRRSLPQPLEKGRNARPAERWLTCTVASYQAGGAYRVPPVSVRDDTAGTTPTGPPATGTPERVDRTRQPSRISRPGLPTHLPLRQQPMSL